MAYAKYISAKEGVLSPSTVKGYSKLSKNTMQGITALPLDILTQEHIQCEVSAMAIDGKSPKYICNAMGLLTAVLSMYRPDFHPHIALPQKRKITDDEITAIIKAAVGSPIELPILMGLWLGMRLSEICRVKFKDLNNHTLHICRAIVESTEADVGKPPKTFSGDRYIRIPPYIESLIQDKFEPCKHDKDGADNYIITLSDHAIYMRFSRLLEKCGIEHCRFHDLRHPYVKPTTKIKLLQKQKSQATKRTDGLGLLFFADTSAGRPNYLYDIDGAGRSGYWDSKYSSQCCSSFSFTDKTSSFFNFAGFLGVP